MKYIKLLLLSLTLSILFVVSAFAADPVGTVTETSNNGNYKYTASLTGDAITADGQYVLLVLKTGKTTASFTADDILYIDQKQGSAGNVTFENFIPKSYVGGTAYITGTGLNSPVTLTPDLPAHGVQYAGTVNSYGSGAPTMTLSNGSNSYDATFTFKSTQGFQSIHNFSFDAVPPGTYTLTISKDGLGTYTETVSIDAGVNNATKSIFRLGDVTHDDKITGADIAKIRDYILEKTTLNQYDFSLADVNKNSSITGSDIAKIRDYILEKISTF